ncbi:kinase-like protein [Stereum hirsutum FP-91666 SS1]|uniref:kinase-like protein n=1 Tax=Stereum hirsutum (strain FP-91666) TaxID=721885 RepID=UPI0004449C24|nr:kinase-like protein [Stereum hirsutum FP-91666 SS1]EIM80920.1 kinase-like protein [Stereum hirsutum FP-91666 SS1]
MPASFRKLFAPFPHDLGDIQEFIPSGRLVSPADSHGTTRVVDIGGGLVVKYGNTTRLSEALASELVRSQTSIPVPRVLAYYSDSSKIYKIGYIVMEKVEGVMLSSILEILDGAAIESITSQLGGYLSEMKKLDRPGEWGMVGKNGIYHRDPYFTYQLPPPSTVTSKKSNPLRARCCRDFVEHFARLVNRSMNEEWAASTQAIVDSFNNDLPSSFCHPDLVPENIMIDERTNRITAIIDWQGAGWYPYFFLSWVAHNRVSAYSPAKYAQWHRIWTALMERYPESVGMNQLLWEADGYGFQDLPQSVCDCCE